MPPDQTATPTPAIPDISATPAEALLPEDSVPDGPDWAGIADESDEFVEGEFVVEEPVAPAAAVVAPAPAPVATPAAAPVSTPPAAPVATPPAAPVATPAAAPVSAPVQVAEPAPAPFDAAAWEAEQRTKLEGLYQLSEEDAAAIVTQPELVIPKLMANSHLQMTKSILSSVQAMLPSLMEAQTQMATAESKARQEFYSINEDLNKPEYEPLVLQMGSMYRTINKGASREEATKRIGDLVRASLGMPLRFVAGGAPAAPQPAAQPAPQAPQPFTPARGGSGGSIPADNSVWTELAREDY